MTNDEREAIERGERRDRKVRETMKLLDAGVEKVLEGEAFKRYLAFAARFHRYSANNSLLILVQRPNATRVAGYRTWQRLDRQVRHGEEGLKILAPIFRTVEDDENGETARVLCSFRAVKVFDVSQTDPVPGAKPLPQKPRPRTLRGDSEAARSLGRSLLAFCESKDVPVLEDDRELDALSPGASGVYLLREKRILVRSTLTADGKAKTLAHELAHHLLHRDAEASEANRPTFEAEAEGTAYAALSYFGVDASEYSFAYVARWVEDKEVVKAALGNIQGTVRLIVEAVESQDTREGGALHRIGRGRIGSFRTRGAPHHPALDTYPREDGFGTVRAQTMEGRNTQDPWVDGSPGRESRKGQWHADESSRSPKAFMGRSARSTRCGEVETARTLVAGNDTAAVAQNARGLIRWS